MKAPKKDGKELDYRDLRCGPHKVLGCLDCWAQIILGEGRWPPLRDEEMLKRLKRLRLIEQNDKLYAADLVAHATRLLDQVRLAISG